MNKPERIVMSMAPNKSYLEGYNCALDACEAYQNHLVDLLSQMIDRKSVV